MRLVAYICNCQLHVYDMEEDADLETFPASGGRSDCRHGCGCSATLTT
jgi:hypothetical protein